MIINPHSTGTIEIKRGVPTLIQFDKPYRFVIKTKDGTIVEGTATPTTPITITAGSDIKDVMIKLDEVEPLHIVK